MSPRRPPAAGRRRGPGARGPVPASGRADARPTDGPGRLTGRRTSADAVAGRTARWTLVTGGLAVLFIEPLAARQPLLFAVNLAVALAFSAAGAIVWDEPGQRATAVAFGIAAILWPAAWLNEWQTGPLPLISTLIGPAPVLVGVWGLLRFPRPWFSGRAGRAILALLVFIATWTVPIVIFSRPSWHSFPPGEAWPTVWPDRTAFHAATSFYDAGTAAVAVGFGALFVIRPIWMSGPDRRYAVPVAGATGAAGLAFAVTGLIWMFGGAESVLYGFSDAEGVILLGVPAAILLVVIRRRLDGGRVAELADRLRATSDIGQVRSALRAMLSDPSAQLWYQVEETGEWLDADGTSGVPPDGTDGRFVHAVAGAEGTTLALLTGDPALARNRPLVETAARAVAASMENGRRQAGLHAEIAGVSRSTARMTTAVDAEQARFAHALEEGTQQRLEGLEERLGDLDTDAAAPAAREVIGEALRQVRETRYELQLLARGQAPPVLGQAGLAPAVGDLVGRLAPPSDRAGGSVVIEVDIPAARFDSPIERAAYFVIAETVTNAVKHARAHRVTIVVTTGADADGDAEPDPDADAHDAAEPGAAEPSTGQPGAGPDGPGASGVLEIVVSDDGRGGADPRGHGLSGIAHRVRALGGTTDVDSPATGGTVISAWLPLNPRN